MEEGVQGCRWPIGLEHFYVMHLGPYFEKIIFYFFFFLKKIVPSAPKTVKNRENRDFSQIFGNISATTRDNPIWFKLGESAMKALQSKL